jgi:carboxypeptidase C (cathepsin A)
MYATIYTAGHMVPTDNPKGAIAMIDKFLKV